MAYTFESGVPIWIQIVSLVEKRILSGEYTEELSLPTVRELAVELAVNPNTVQRAYGRLEEIGLVETRRTSGRYVTQDRARLEEIRRAKGRQALAQGCYEARALGLTKAETMRMIDEIMVNQENREE
ncbi:MAG: GntR family transcriptional regulator [Christensenellaceae bacterium]